jgi:hypothetical protein
MKVRMKGDITGTRNGVPWPPLGGEIDLPDEEGAALCATGMAVPVKDDQVETATPPAEDETREALVPTEQAKPRRRG